MTTDKIIEYLSQYQLDYMNFDSNNTHIIFIDHDIKVDYFDIYNSVLRDIDFKFNTNGSINLDEQTETILNQIKLLLL
ncbi:MAG: hypothetical protein DRG78_15325 [Epsilonproteobacteria bacterium]|nr:MAG: hypothetical protein DRG78_15325 [Campylobacterota bacterium]